jgi:3-oxoacyl-[acyl-carrier-protein] synthase-3
MIYLHGIGHFHPENIITNKFLEELEIGTTEEWILERVGIKERHTSLPLDYIKTTKNRDPRAAQEATLYTNATAGAAAGRIALKRAGIKAENVGLLISGTSLPEICTPAEAASIAAELEIDVPCFDLNSACSTFAMQINFLDRMRPEALPAFILLVNPEHATRCVDYSDRASAVLFGDGSAAAVVSAVVPSRAGLMSCYCDSKPSSWRKIMAPRMGYFQQDGQAVQGFAIRKTTDSLRMLKSAFPVAPERFKFIGHQANRGMLATVCERSGISEGNHWHNVEYFGNTACSGAPAVLSQHWDDLCPGDHVAIALVGAGLTWAHMMLKMEEI